MGQMLIDAVGASSDCLLSGALDIAASPAIGSDAMAFAGRTSGVRIASDLHEGPEKFRRADRLHPAGRHDGASGGLPRAGREAGHRHDRFQRYAKSGNRLSGQRRCHRHGAQHERGRQCHFKAAGDGGESPFDRLRHRDHRSPSPPTRSMRLQAPR